MSLRAYYHHHLHKVDGRNQHNVKAVAQFWQEQATNQFIAMGVSQRNLPLLKQIIFREVVRPFKK